MGSIIRRILPNEGFVAARVISTEDAIDGLSQSLNNFRRGSVNWLVQKEKLDVVKAALVGLQKKQKTEADLAFVLKALIEFGHAFFHKAVIDSIKTEIERNSEFTFSLDNLIWCFSKSAQNKFIDENPELRLSYDDSLDDLHTIVCTRFEDIHKRIDLYGSDSYVGYELTLKLIQELRVALSNLGKVAPELRGEILNPNYYTMEAPAPITAVAKISAQEESSKKPKAEQPQTHLNNLKLEFAYIINRTALQKRVKSGTDGRKALNPQNPVSEVPDDATERQSANNHAIYPQEVAGILRQFENEFTRLFPTIASVHFLRIIVELLSNPEERKDFFYTTKDGTTNRMLPDNSGELAIFKNSNPVSIIECLKRLLTRQTSWNFDISAFALAILKEIKSLSEFDLERQITAILEVGGQDSRAKLTKLEHGIKAVTDKQTGGITISSLDDDNKLFLQIVILEIQQQFPTKQSHRIFWQDYLYTELVREYPSLAYLVLSQANTLEQFLQTLGQEA